MADAIAARVIEVVASADVTAIGRQMIGADAVISYTLKSPPVGGDPTRPSLSV